MSSKLLLTIPTGENSIVHGLRQLAAERKRPLTQLIRAAIRLALANPEMLEKHIVAIRYGNQR